MQASHLVNREFIVAEIRRTAEENGGRPLGFSRFEKATGIARSEWFGKHWARWGDAVIEAGLAPNKLTKSYDHEVLFEKLIGVIRQLGRFPVTAELRLLARKEPGFPSHTVFARLGRKYEVAAKLVAYCENREELDDISEICRPIAKHRHSPTPGESIDETENFGHVYLIRSGRHYKIGRTQAFGRREYELAIQLPERAEKIHLITTDDPIGIEAYWHNRFADKRMNGEWFDLSAADIKAFKRRKFM
jgi:hypothetical protein